MSISRRLMLASMVPALMTLVIAGGLVSSYTAVSSLQRQQALAIQTSADVNELSNLALSFVLTHGDRPRRQFTARLRETDAQIAQASAADPRYGVQLRGIAENVRVSATLFESVVSNYEQRASVPPGVFREAEDRLSGQLFIRLRDVSGRASALSRRVNDDIVATQRRIYLLVAAFTFLAAVLLTAGLLALRSTITRSLKVLSAGTERIGGGDLEYRIGMTGSDELGELGRSFDRMSERLKGVTVSKERLEQEVEERRTAEERLRESLETNDVLLKAANALATRSSLTDVLDTLTALILRVTSHSRISVFLWEEDEARLVALASTGDSPLPIGTAFELSDFSEPAKNGISEHKTRIIDYDALIPEHRGEAARFASHLAAGIPLVYRDKFFGLLTIDDPGTRREFGKREIELMEGIASQAAVALENARLFEADRASQEEATRELETTRSLLNAATAMAEWTDQQAVVEQLGRSIRVATGRRRVWVHSWDAQRRTTRIVAAVGDKPAPLGMEFELDQLAEPAKNGFLEQRTAIVDVDALPEEERSAYAPAFGFRCLLVVPIVRASQVIGAVTVDDPDEHHDFGIREIGLIEGIASAAGVAIENARLYDEERASRRVTEALSRIDESVHSTLQRDEMLARVAEESAEAIGADGTVLALCESDGWIVRYEYNMDPAIVGRPFTLDEVPFLRIAAETERPVAIDDAFHDPRTRLDTQEGLGVRAVMVSPLIVRGETIGALFLNYREVHRFTAQDVRYAARLGTSLGLALENARLYETERDIADRLQEALLSMPQHVGGLEFAHAYHSATEAARVGGDFYDLFELSHDHIGIVIGDVAGKGLDAAVLTSMVKNTIRAHASEEGKTPAQILRLTNDIIYRATATESFVTVFLGLLDCGDGRLTYSNAGHTTGALIGRGRGVVKLPVSGPLLGAFADVGFEQAEARMELGEALFLYTDGLTEARSDGHMYGEGRVFDFLASLAGRTAHDVVESVIADVMSFTGNRLRDDLAILAVRRVEQGAETPQEQKLEV